MRQVRFSILALILVFPVFLVAQQEKIDEAMMARIREEGLDHSRVSWIAHNLTDVNGPRLTNSTGYRKASAWVVSTLKSWGLPAHLEPWGEFGYGWDVLRSSLSMQKPYYEPLIAYASPWCGSTNGKLNAEVFLLEHIDTTYIEKMGNHIKGKIVLLQSKDSTIRSDFEPDATRYSDSSLQQVSDKHMISKDVIKMFLTKLKKINAIKKWLMKKGAIALISAGGGNEGRDGTVFVGGLGDYLKINQPLIPEMIVSTEACLKMQRLIHSGIRVKLDIDLKTKLLSDDTKGYNVVGEIPGTDPKLKAELVILGGHLDSWASATGATDNAAGCIASLEAIRILKTLGVSPKRTIRIALWGGEEQGLLGSFNYVKKHFGNPADMRLKPEQQKVSAYYNLDNGSGKIRGIFNQGNEAVTPIFSKWLQPFNDLDATTVTPHNTGSTDHLSFDAVGIPGFQFIQDPLDYATRTHHSNMDDYDHLSLSDLQQAAVIMAAFVYNTAMRDEMLPRKPLPKPEKFIFEEFVEAIK